MTSNLGADSPASNPPGQSEIDAGEAIAGKIIYSKNSKYQISGGLAGAPKAGEDDLARIQQTFKAKEFEIGTADAAGGILHLDPSTMTGTARKGVIDGGRAIGGKIKFSNGVFVMTGGQAGAPETSHEDVMKLEADTNATIELGGARAEGARLARSRRAEAGKAAKEAAIPRAGAP